jgi:beta-N-acetylhexosaminidase
MLDVEPISRPSSDAVQRFLREYADQLADQRLVVFALNAPYFLDATEMSRLAIYYGVYSKAEPFLESAVRALFRAFTPSSAPPVNVPGTRFASLAARLSPDPAQSVLLQVEDAAGTVLLDSGDSEAAVATSAEAPAGATLSLVAGPIVDWNGNIVPDGTLVTFRLQYEGDALALRVEPAPSRGGVAMRDVLLDRPGTLRIAAEAGAATSGDPLSVVILPPPTPTPSPASGVAEQGAAGGDGESAPVDRASIVTLLIALLTILVTLSLFLIVQVRVLPRATLVRNMLWAAIFGLAGYILYATGLIPGSDWLRSNVSVWGTSVVVLVPMLLPLLWLGLRSDDK